ncbi:hypothetical protein XELAEV_18013307mg [Xenopus laevis]|uniref:Uncharacterized protein n=1 Tax=Xenopus laevis TaxID=8355 RepID=A0A974DPE1_XENLA|nr:hypothetical protein XELAEV_18013307mg [Xenopus laevis]
MNKNKVLALQGLTCTPVSIELSTKAVIYGKYSKRVNKGFWVIYINIDGLNIGLWSSTGVMGKAVAVEVVFQLALFLSRMIKCSEVTGRFLR